MDSIVFSTATQILDFDEIREEIKSINKLNPPSDQELIDLGRPLHPYYIAVSRKKELKKILADYGRS